MQSTASMSGFPDSRAIRVESARSSRPDLAGDGAKVVCLFDAGHAPPVGLRAGGGVHRRGNVVLVAVGHEAQQVERGGVPDLPGGAAVGGHPGAIDEDGRDVGHAVVLVKGGKRRWPKMTGGVLRGKRAAMAGGRLRPSARFRCTFGRTRAESPATSDASGQRGLGSPDEAAER